MTQVREERDGDRTDSVSPSRYRTEFNRFERPCSECGRVFYDSEESASNPDVSAQDRENTFVCPDCEESLWFSEHDPMRGD